MMLCMQVVSARSLSRVPLPSAGRQPARRVGPTRIAASASTDGANRSLKRSLSAHSRCEIATPDGVQCYCNVIRSASNDNGEEGFQFVVVFMKDDDVLESSEYEYYQSEWFSTLDECEAAIQTFDIKQHLPDLVM